MHDSKVFRSVRFLLLRSLLCGLVLFVWIWPAASAHAQTNDPFRSQQTYLDVIRMDEVRGRIGTQLPVRTAIIGMGNVLPTHEDLRPTIPDLIGRSTPLDRQPPNATFAGGVMHAVTNNGVGIAGIDERTALNQFNDRFYSYDAGRIDDFEDIRDALFSFDIRAATAQTLDAINDKDVDILLTPVAVFTGQTPEVEARTNFLASPIQVPGQPPAEVPAFIGDIFIALGGWLLKNEDRKSALADWMRAHFSAAFNGRFSVAPVGDFDGSAQVYPASLSNQGLTFAVGGTNDRGEFRWPNSAIGTIDVVAPAENVFSTANEGSASYGTESSTAASAAMVAGVASILKSVDQSLEGEDLRQILRRTARDIPPVGYDKETGFGILDAKAAFDYVKTRSFTRGTVSSGGDIDIIQDGNVKVTLISSPWEKRADGVYFFDRQYRVQWVIDLPRGAGHDVWIDLSGTKGWRKNQPATGVPHAEIEVRSWESKATITVYGYEGDNTDNLGRLISVAGAPVVASKAKVSYVIATKPGEPPSAPVTLSMSGPSDRDSDQLGTWTANVAGGNDNEPVSFDWKYRNPGSSAWYSASCSGANCSLRFYNGTPGSQHGYIRVTVDKGSVTKTVTRTIRVHPTSGGGCSDPRFCTAVGYRPDVVRGLMAEATEEGIVLQWSTLSSLSPNRFSVEHRADSTDAWREIGTASIEEARTDSSGLAHSFRAGRLGVGDHQFRLGYVLEKSGSSTYSNTVTTSVRLSGAFSLVTYPNPVRGQFTVELAVQTSQAVRIEIYDVLGRRVTTVFDRVVSAQRTHYVPVNLARRGMTSGAYFVHVIGETFHGAKRLAVVR